MTAERSSFALRARPRLSVCVIVPALNRAATLSRCIASVWAQRPHLPAEVVVVDDGSSDDTALATRLGASIVQHPVNRGLSAARNSGLYATECEWVAFLDSDDEWLPGHLDHLWRLRDVTRWSAARRCGAEGGLAATVSTVQSRASPWCSAHRSGSSPPKTYSPPVPA